MTSRNVLRRSGKYGYGLKYRKPFIVLFYGGTSCRLPYSAVSEVQDASELSKIVVSMFSAAFAKDQGKGVQIELESFRRLGLERKVIGFFSSVSNETFSLEEVAKNLSIVYPEISPTLKKYRTRYSSSFYHLITCDVDEHSKFAAEVADACQKHIPLHHILLGKDWPNNVLRLPNVPKFTETSQIKRLQFEKAVVVSMNKFSFRIFNDLKSVTSFQISPLLVYQSLILLLGGSADCEPKTLTELSIRNALRSGEKNIDNTTDLMTTDQLISAVQSLRHGIIHQSKNRKRKFADIALHNAFLTAKHRIQKSFVSPSGCGVITARDAAYREISCKFQSLKNYRTDMINATVLKNAKNNYDETDKCVENAIEKMLRCSKELTFDFIPLLKLDKKTVSDPVEAINEWAQLRVGRDILPEHENVIGSRRDSITTIGILDMSIHLQFDKGTCDIWREGKQMILNGKIKCFSLKDEVRAVELLCEDSRSISPLSIIFLTIRNNSSFTLSLYDFICRSLRKKKITVKLPHTCFKKRKPSFHQQRTTLLEQMCSQAGLRKAFCKNAPPEAEITKKNTSLVTIGHILHASCANLNIEQTCDQKSFSVETTDPVFSFITKKSFMIIRENSTGAILHIEKLETCN